MGGTSKTIAVDRAPERSGAVVRGVAIILLGSVLFGSMAVCVRLASREMGAQQITFVRFLGSLLVLLAFRNGQSLRPRSGRWKGLFLRGLLGSAAISLYYRAIAGAGAGLATLLQCTYPVYTALFATRLLGERFDARLGLALALGVTGAMVIVAPAVSVAPAIGVAGLCALGAAVLAGAAVATARHLRMTETAFLVTTYFMAIGTVFSAPAVLSGLPALSPPLLFALAGVVLTSVGGQMLLHHGLGFAPATQASLAAATSTVTAVTLGALFLGERLGMFTFFGACLLLGAVALASGRRAPRPEPLPPPLP